MNVVLSSTGFNVPNHQLLLVNKDNIAEMELKDAPPSSIDNLVIHRCFHLMEFKKILELINSYMIKLKPEGKLTIYCLDVYLFCHKVHRRELSEADLNSVLYENGQMNCFSTLFMIESCINAGFKKTGVCINESLYAKLEFTK